MNKKELIEKVSAKAGVSKKDTEAILNAFTANVIETLKEGDKIQMVGFGTFEVQEKPGRIGRNPKTGEPMEIAASRVPKFKFGKTVKDQM